jgi:hypothetical protein
MALTMLSLADVLNIGSNWMKMTKTPLAFWKGYLVNWLHYRDVRWLVIFQNTQNGKIWKPSESPEVIASADFVRAHIVQILFFFKNKPLDIVMLSLESDDPKATSN